MPKITINPVEAWYPTSTDERCSKLSDDQRFTLHFLYELPVVMAGAMRRGFGEHIDHRTVIPRIIGPTIFKVRGTPDIDLVASPSFTEARWERRGEFLEALAAEINATRDDLQSRLDVELQSPHIDIDVDFVNGPGLALDRNGDVTSRWPKEPEPSS